jgi:hypothetical protein
LAACASTPLKPKGEAIRIELTGKAGASSETRYYSNANVKTYSDGQILRDKQEIVDFTTLTQIKSYDEKEKILSYSVRTVKKDGPVDLHDLAFPEKNERIEYTVRSDGTVIKAGSYSPQTLFFVPSLPIPKDEVRVGDTWTMEHTWFSAHDQIPLKLDVIGILKALVPCAGKTCADIEISGSVQLAQAPTAQGARFESRVWGRLLYSPERGDVIWSEMRSQEEMQVGSDKFTVLSCMTSETKINDYKTKLECQPAQTPVTSVPTNL